MTYLEQLHELRALRREAGDNKGVIIVLAPPDFDGEAYTLDLTRDLIPFWGEDDDD